VSPEPSRPVKVILGAICLCILGGILTLGLWPFGAPANDVAWLKHENGLWFGEYGSILSSGVFADRGDATPCSVEIWIDPGETFDSNNLIAFYTPENPKQFGVEQSGDDLFVARQIPQPDHQFRSEHIFVDHVFRRGIKVLVTVTSGQDGSRIYLNGNLVKTSPEFRFTSKDVVGLLIVANSPVSNYSWAGNLRGLAFYSSELNAGQVAQDYQIWSKNEDSTRLTGQSCRAIYPFRERSGSVVHNQVAAQPDLFIPRRYFVLHERVLDWPWREFHWSMGYLQDDVVNVTGLIPLGLFFCAYFARVQRRTRPVLAAILVGAMASLTIEVTQGWLPTRDSSCTDVITNISGTAIGALFYRLRVTQFLFAKFEGLVDACFRIKST